jgi:hypothetical protein
VDLAGLDDKDVFCAALEGLAVYCPDAPAFTYELDLVIRMAVRTGFSWCTKENSQNRETIKTL